MADACAPINYSDRRRRGKGRSASLDAAAVQNAQDAAPTILDEAAAIVAGPRQRAYGEPTAALQRIARLWAAYLADRPNPATPIDAADVARMMILAKSEKSKRGS